MIFVLPHLFSKVIRGVGEQCSRAWCFAPFTGGKGGIKQSWFLSLSQASLAHTLTATRSHQDTQTHLAGAGSLMGSTEDKGPYWVFLHLLASSCLAVTSWLLGRTGFSFPSRIKFRIAFTAINLGRGCWKVSLLPSAGNLCAYSLIFLLG